MKRIWAFLSQRQNLTIVAALAGGLGFLWKEVIAPRLDPKPEAPAVTSQQATAEGGTAVNAAGQAQVTIGGKPASAAAAGMAASLPALPASQSARAGSGGTAVNASDSARVTVRQGGGGAQ